MNKRGWLVVVWLGVVASTGALAGNEIGGVAVKAQPAFDRQTVASVDNVSYSGSNTAAATGGVPDASKSQAGAGLLSFDSSAGTGNTYGALILAALGALAISATRRRGR